MAKEPPWLRDHHTPRIGTRDWGLFLSKRGGAGVSWTVSEEEAGEPSRRLLVSQSPGGSLGRDMTPSRSCQRPCLYPSTTSTWFQQQVVLCWTWSKWEGAEPGDLDDDTWTLAGFFSSSSPHHRPIRQYVPVGAKSWGSASSPSTLPIRLLS